MRKETVCSYKLVNSIVWVGNWWECCGFHEGHSQIATAQGTGGVKHCPITEE